MDNTMDEFHGFPPGEMRTTPLPDVFFSHVLPQITDSAELKVTLHVFWRCHRGQGRLRSVSRDELLADVTLRRSLSGAEDWQAAAVRGLEAAVRRETLLEFRSGDAQHYAPNTAANRTRLLSAKPEDRPTFRPVKPLPPQPDPLSPARTLYEHYIGLVTPIVAQELAEAEKNYPAQWVAEAFAEAAQRGKRNWNYVQAILRGWASGGRR
jgi:DnaD/phage-associated family protein